MEVIVSKAGAFASNFTDYKPVTLQYAPLPKAKFDIAGVALGRTVQTVSLSGRNLQGAKVKVGNTEATVTKIAADGTSLEFRAPVNGGSTPTSRDVLVTTAKARSSSASSTGPTCRPSLSRVSSTTRRPAPSSSPGTGLSSVSPAGIKVDGIALPATTKLTYVPGSANNTGTLQIPLADGGSTVSVKNAKDASFGTERNIPRTIATNGAVFNSTTNKLTITGTNLTGLSGDDLVFAGHGVFVANVDNSASNSATSVTFELVAPHTSVAYLAPKNTATPETWNHDSATDSDGTGTPDVPKVRTTVSIPNLTPNNSRSSSASADWPEHGTSGRPGPPRGRPSGGPTYFASDTAATSAAAVTVSPLRSSRTSTTTSSPSLDRAASSARASVSPIAFCTSRRSGRAPYAGS